MNEDITGLAAVYWSPNSPTSGTVYTKYIADLSISNPTSNAIRTGFAGVVYDWAYVVTWKDMTPNREPIDTTQVVTSINNYYLILWAT